MKTALCSILFVAACGGAATTGSGPSAPGSPTGTSSSTTATGSGTAAPGPSFHSNFASGSLDQFEIFDVPNASEGPSDWKIINHELHQTSNIFGTPDPADSTQNHYTGSMAIVRNLDAKDLTYTITFTPGDEDGVGAVFGFQDKDHYARFISLAGNDNGGPVARIDRIDGDKLTILASSKDHYNSSTQNTYKIVIRGNDITASINNTVTLHATDPAYSGGRIGLSLYAESGVVFHQLDVGP